MHISRSKNNNVVERWQGWNENKILFYFQIMFRSLCDFIYPSKKSISMMAMELIQFRIKYKTYDPFIDIYIYIYIKNIIVIKVKEHDRNWIKDWLIGLDCLLIYSCIYEVISCQHLDDPYVYFWGKHGRSWLSSHDLVSLSWKERKEKKFSTEEKKKIYHDFWSGFESAM